MIFIMKKTLLSAALLLMISSAAMGQSLAWDPSANAEKVGLEGYYIYMDNFETPIATLDSDTTTYPLPDGLVAGQWYIFAVSAFNKNGESPKLHGKYRHVESDGKELYVKKGKVYFDRKVYINGEVIEIWGVNSQE